MVDVAEWPQWLNHILTRLDDSSADEGPSARHGRAMVSPTLRKELRDVCIELHHLHEERRKLQASRADLFALAKELCESDDELGWVEAGAPEEAKAFERWERAWNAVRDTVHGKESTQQITRRLAREADDVYRADAERAHQEVGKLTSLVLEAWRLQSVAPLEKVIVIHPGDGLPSVDLSKGAREQSAVVAQEAPPLRPAADETSERKGRP